MTTTSEHLWTRPDAFFAVVCVRCGRRQDSLPADEHCSTVRAVTAHLIGETT